MMWDITTRREPERPSTVRQRLAVGLRETVRNIVPVLTLSAALFFAYLYADRFVTGFDVFGPERWMWNPGYWLTVGHLLLPVSFFLLMMTNRKRGAAAAYGQMLGAWLALGVFAFLIQRYYGHSFSVSPLPALGMSLSFLLALGMAQVVSIEIFDKIRGVTWWGAPFFAQLWAALAFVLVYHPLNNLGSSDLWVERMVLDFVIKAAFAILMLVPYALLRKLVRPAPGFGGA